MEPELKEQIEIFESVERWLTREAERVPKRPLRTSGWKRLSEIHQRHLHLQRRYQEFLQKHGLMRKNKTKI